MCSFIGIILKVCYMYAYNRLREMCFYKYEGWNFNSGNYLFTTDTK